MCLWAFLLVSNINNTGLYRCIGESFGESELLTF